MGALFVFHAFGQTLTHRLVHHHAGSHGDIQRAYGTDNGYCRQGVAQAQTFVGNPGILGTHDYSHRPGKISVGVGSVPLLGSAHHLQPALFEETQGGGYGTLSADGM